MADLNTPLPVIAMAGIARSFGSVKALRGVDLVINPGEVVGLVGHNGAGKSTLMNILSGVLSFDEGSYAVGGSVQGNPGAKSPGDSGIGCVSQELLLAPNLTVAENARILHRGLTGFGWRRRAGEIMLKSLDAIFPGHGIVPEDVLGDLPIGKRQMVEIARAFAGRDLKLMILDEPTSSLDGQASEQLLSYVEMRRRQGLSIILISHLLGEILAVSNRVVVMRDGKIVRDSAAAGLTRADLVEAMGHTGDAAHAGHHGEPARGVAISGGTDCIRYQAKRSDALPIAARHGEVIGLAGLAGRGQTDFLHTLVDGRGVIAERGAKKGAVAFVAGDRRADGVFPAWSVQQNLTIRAMRSLKRFGFLSARRERELTRQWKDKIEVRTATLDTDIVTLSGGNQQKVLFARALASDATIILMDDPMRGVDVGTKMEVYRLIREEAEKGRCFIWYTTEFDELNYCDRVYVFRDGVAAAEFKGDDIHEKNIVGASFAA